jgi:hypothetical protein
MLRVLARMSTYSPFSCFKKYKSTCILLYADMYFFIVMHVPNYKTCVNIQKNACQRAFKISTCMSIKRTCQHTEECMSTCIPNQTCVHVNIQKNACRHAFQIEPACQRKSHVNIQPLFLAEVESRPCSPCSSVSPGRVSTCVLFAPEAPEITHFPSAYCLRPKSRVLSYSTQFAANSRRKRQTNVHESAEKRKARVRTGRSWVVLC